MNVLISLVACFSYTTIVAFSYTVFWGLSRHLFKKLKIYYELLLGFILGLVSCLSILIISLISGKERSFELIVMLPTFLYWISIFFISIFSSLGILTFNILNLVLFSTLFPQYFAAVNNTLTMVLIIFSYIIPFILFLAQKAYKNLSSWSCWSIVTIVLLLFGIFWNLPIINTPAGFSSSMNLLIWLGSGYLSYAYIALINQIYIHALKLQNIIRYENTYYLNFVGAHEQVLNEIAKNKTRYGIYLTYFISDFETFEAKIHGTIKDFIVNSISTSVYELINANFTNVVFFKPNYKTFAAFIPIEVKANFEESNNQNIHKIRSIMEKINTKFVFEKYKISVKLKSVCSYYGLHSNNLDTLLDYNKYVENSFFFIKKDRHIIVKPKEVLDEKNRNKKIILLNEIANLNHFATLFEPIFDSQNSQYDSYFLNGLIGGIEINSELFSKKLREINNMGLTSLFLRFISLQVLKKLSKQSEQIKSKFIFINYDSEFLATTDFSIREFILKINALKLDLSKLVFNFNLNKEVEDKLILEKNIAKLKRNKIKISVYNFGSIGSDFSLLDLYRPEFIFIESDICKKIQIFKENELIIKECIKISSRLDVKLIATGIDGYSTFKTLKEIGINFFTGQLIGSSVEPKEIISDELRYLLNK